MAIYQFEYHTFLHHSQTWVLKSGRLPLFEYHTFLHHSQTSGDGERISTVFEYHTFLHHSQTIQIVHTRLAGLSTIHFYIILKQLQNVFHCS